MLIELACGRPAKPLQIWVEIVAARKKELAAMVDHKMDLTTALAAKITLERGSLAEWDNSAGHGFDVLMKRRGENRHSSC